MNQINTDWFESLVSAWAFPVNDMQTVVSKGLRRGGDYPAQLVGPFPIALSAVAGVAPSVAMSGSVLRYYGETQFYITPNNDLNAQPDMLLWSRLILEAASAHKTLNGNATDFSIPDEENAIEFVAIQYNDEDVPHWGVRVRWVVTIAARIEVQP